MAARSGKAGVGAGCSGLHACMHDVQRCPGHSNTPTIPATQPPAVHLPRPAPLLLPPSPHDGAARLDGLDDLARLVAGQREARGGAVDLHRAPQRLLRRRRHAAGRRGAVGWGGGPRGAAAAHACHLPPAPAPLRTCEPLARALQGCAGRPASPSRHPTRQPAPHAAPTPAPPRLSASSRTTIFWRPGGSVTFCCANILILLRTWGACVWGAQGEAGGGWRGR